MESALPAGLYRNVLLHVCDGTYEKEYFCVGTTFPIMLVQAMYSVTMEDLPLRHHCLHLHPCSIDILKDIYMA